MISVRLRLFGPLKDIARVDEISLQVPPPYTGDSAFEVLARTFPDLRQWRPSIRLAVNLSYVPFDTPLKGGDEIGFIPPVSGG